MRLRRLGILFLILLFVCPGVAYAASWADEVMADLAKREILEAVPDDPDVYISSGDFNRILQKALPNGNIEEENEDFLTPETSDERLTRQDAAVLLGLRLDLDMDDAGGAPTRFADDAALSDHARDTVRQLSELNIINGYPDGTFKPLNNISFAESSSLIHKALTRLEPYVERAVEAELTTYFGSGNLGNADGTDAETHFALPSGISEDNDGNLIVFDTYNAGIKKISAGRSETLIGFNRVPDDYGFTKAFYLDAARQNALLGRPADGVYAPNGDLYFTDSANHAIRVLRQDMVYTVAGGTLGFADGRSSEARFNYPTAMTAGRDGALYVADTLNHCIRSIDADGNVKTVAGVAERQGYRDGPVSQALFNEPMGLAVDNRGSVYVADTGNHVIRKIDSGYVTTLTGVFAQRETSEDYSAGGYTDGIINKAEFKFPRGLYYNDGVLYIADTGNHAIRAIIHENSVITLAGNGDPGDEDGRRPAAMMNKPTAITGKDNSLYITDSLNNKVKMIRYNRDALK